MKHGLRAAAAAALVVAGMATVGCGNDDESSTTTTSTAVSGEGPEIKMGDFYFDPEDATAKAGSVAISAPNVGNAEHELVLFKSELDPAKLPTSANGEVDEEKLAAEAEEVGEIADIPPGDTGTGVFEMTAGKYVMFCNLPGHYAQGMYGSVTVQ